MILSIQDLWIFGFPVIILFCYLFNRFKHEGNAKFEVIGIGALCYMMGFAII